MKKLIRKSTYQVMPWKNGLGVTAEIKREPLNGEGFLWRFSQAIVEASSPFSFYPGFDRWLVVVEGEGLKLNEKILRPLNPIRFSGDDKIDCSPLGPRVQDLGFIFARGDFAAEMNVISSDQLLSPEKCYFLYDLQSGDTVFIEDENEVTLSSPDSSAPAKAILISFAPLKS